MLSFFFFFFLCLNGGVLTREVPLIVPLVLREVPLIVPLILSVSHLLYVRGSHIIIWEGSHFLYGRGPLMNKLLK